VSEQRYQAVLAVIAEGCTVTEVAARWGVSRETLHAWLGKYEAGGLENLGDGSHRPVSCPHQMAADAEVVIAGLRRAHPSWGSKRLVFELAKRGVVPVPSESGVYRALVRLNLIDPDARRPRERKWKRWERGVPMELWQMDVVGGFVLADGTKAKVLTGVDDHSRFCVCAQLMPRESSRYVCDGLAGALRRWGVPGEILTDNGKVFTGRFSQPPAEVLFDRICRENGITHRLTQPRSPTTTGKIERFHRTLRTEFRTDRVFKNLAAAQAELDEWVLDYNTHRPHQAIGMAPPAATSTCGSPMTSYSSSTATTCCAPRSEPTTTQCARSEPRSPPERPPIPNQRVKDQPNENCQPSTEVRHRLYSAVQLT